MQELFLVLVLESEVRKKQENDGTEITIAKPRTVTVKVTAIFYPPVDLLMLFLYIESSNSNLTYDELLLDCTKRESRSIRLPFFFEVFVLVGKCSLYNVDLKQQRHPVAACSNHLQLQTWKLPKE